MNPQIMRQLWLARGAAADDRENALDRPRGPKMAMAKGAIHPELSVRDSLVLMLHVAAEIEHALLVQYLFAAYSIQPRVPIPGSSATTNKWREAIINTAQEEMGHLITVQNALTLLGGPLHFDRDNFPHLTHLYPFPFELERLTIESLSRFIAAEMPEETLIPDSILTAEQLDAVKQVTGGTVNRVGVLYKMIGDAIHELNRRIDLWPEFQPWQADGREWSASFVRPGDLPTPPTPAKGVVASQMLTKADLAKVLAFVATQGESPDVMFMDSHFYRFAKVYQEWETARQQDRNFDPVYRIVTNPNTTLPPEPGDQLTKDEEAREAILAAGRLSDPKAQLWAHLFNVRYRILLTSIHHYLALGPTTIPESNQLAREELAVWAFEEMTNGSINSNGEGRDGLGTIRSMSSLLVALPSGISDYKAGPPFELPYTLELPPRGPARWRLYRELFEASRRLAAELQKIGPSTEEASELASIIRRDEGRQSFLLSVEDLEL